MPADQHLDEIRPTLRGFTDSKHQDHGRSRPHPADRKSNSLHILRSMSPVKRRAGGCLLVGSDDPWRFELREHPFIIRRVPGQASSGAASSAHSKAHVHLPTTNLEKHDVLPGWGQNQVIGRIGPASRVDLGAGGDCAADNPCHDQGIVPSYVRGAEGTKRHRENDASWPRA